MSKKNISLDNLEKFKENLDKNITKHVTLTQAEYNALTTEERNNGTVYFVSDGIADISDADIEYIDSQDAKTLSSAKEYTNTKIADLINGAPETLDTLGEISQAMSDNKDVVKALDEAIGTKAASSDLTSHTGNTSNPHGITKAQVGLGNVENKSSAAIRGELTKSDVTTALGYTPSATDTTYTLPTATSSVLGGVKTGDNITNTSGTISITKDNVTSALGYTPPSSTLFKPRPDLNTSIGQNGLTFTIPSGAYLMFYSAYGGMYGFIISLHGDSVQLHKLGNTLSVTAKEKVENGTRSIELYVPGQYSGTCYFYQISLS